VVSGIDRSELLRLIPNRGTRQRYYAGDDQYVFVTPSSDGALRLITLAPVPYRTTDLLPYFALITAGVALLFWLLVADLVRPIRRLSAAVQRFGRGALDARAPLTRRDEIGQLAMSFNEMASRIETLVASERRLLQDVSHELRSPLTRLNLGIELLRTATDREQAADRLQREASRLSDLVATLLEVARLEGDPLAAPAAAVNVAEVLHDSISDAITEAVHRQITVSASGTADGIARGNAELLRRAFDNVIGNAIRYAPAGTDVTITSTRTALEQIVEVRDSGPGVQEEQIARLGDPFYRADAARSGSTGGVGLGLAIARRAVHLHRGTIEISNAHPGLRVTIRIPVDGVAPPAADVSPAPPPQQDRVRRAFGHASS
jgi:two-component system sensor histidine kinase CpxA